MTQTLLDPIAAPNFDFCSGRIEQKPVDHDGQIAGIGASDNYAQTPSTAGSAFSYYLENKATTGTARGMYLRLKLPSGAGGEAARIFTTVENATPADTCNGAHISLNFGTSAGNITGEAQAVRGTFHYPTGRTIGGTVAAIKAEAYADGAAPAVSNGALIRATIAGDATGVGVLDDNLALINLDGGANGSGNICSAAGNEPTWTSATHKIRVKVNGTTMYLVAVLA